MKFECSKSELLHGVSTVSKAVPNKTTLSILECILIDTTKGYITLTANDMELGIETVIDGTIIEKGVIALDAKLFSDIVRKLPDSLVTVEVDNNYKTTISCEKAKFNIIGKSGDDFSYLPTIERTESIVLSQFSLKEIVRQTIFSIGNSDSNKVMSGELFEIREANGQSHKYDFLTVGSMGHSSSIALGVAINKPNTRIWCVDGDGAVLMHMGSLAVLGANKPKNMIHVVINNGAHETVGGMPTVAASIDLVAIAKACGYPNAVCVDSFEALDKELEAAKARNELSLIEVKCSIGARDDLGRPTTTALENKQNFMEYLKTL